MALLYAIEHVVNDNFVFQQDNAPIHCALSTVELLQRETRNFISPELWPSNGQVPKPTIYKVAAVIQQHK